MGPVATTTFSVGSDNIEYLAAVIFWGKFDVCFLLVFCALVYG